MTFKQIKRLKVLVEMVQPRKLSKKLEQHILIYIDDWLRQVFANRVLNCKSTMEITFSIKQYEVVLNLSMTDYDIPKGIFMPFFTQVSYKVQLKELIGPDFILEESSIQEQLSNRMHNSNFITLSQGVSASKGLGFENTEAPEKAAAESKLEARTRKCSAIT